MLVVLPTILCICAKLALAKVDRVKDWELSWIHGSIAPTDIDAETIARFNAMRTDGLALTTPKQPYYTEADLNQARMAPLCQFRMRKPGATHFCSCSFIADDLVATAAHCFFTNGITPTSGHKLYVTQHYGKGGNSKKYDSFTRNLVTDWWYPKELKTPNQKPNEMQAYDIAFLKTKDKVTKFFTLTATPVDDKSMEEGKYMVVGYPYDYRNSEVAVKTTGSFVHDTDVAGIVHLQNDYVPKGAEIGKVHPLMQEGGSGGPILSTKEDMKLLSVLSMGHDEDFLKTMTKESFTETGLMIVTPKLVQVAAHIHQKGVKGGKVGKKLTTGEEEVTLTL